jgi:hypothetical protein
MPDLASVVAGTGPNPAASVYIRCNSCGFETTHVIIPGSLLLRRPDDPQVTRFRHNAVVATLKELNLSPIQKSRISFIASIRAHQRRHQ